ncbi:hypothetical protein C8R43DRAFT_1139623 [Mycena crocata]|nr:hypothetical protein C8R43DRAFT_1139623 [Mycena crocata]
MPSVSDLLARRLEDPAVPLLSRAVYGPDFSRRPVGSPDCSRCGMLNSYDVWGTGDPFLPLVVGVIDRIRPSGGNNSPLALRLAAPVGAAGHSLDVIYWDQLQTLRRVMDAECRGSRHEVWSAEALRDVPCELSSVEPWSSGPASDTDPVGDVNRVYICVDVDSAVVRATPGRLFVGIAESFSSERSAGSGSSVTLDHDSLPSRNRGLAIGDLVLVRCRLFCNHVLCPDAGRTRNPGPVPLIRSYQLVATELFVVV